MTKTVSLLNQTVGTMRRLGAGVKSGNLFGVELELEGKGVGLPDVATRGWARHNDGSLRGESIEFILSTPQPFDKTQKFVQNLFDKFQEHNVKIKDSIRTSTHVHLNFSDKPLKQAFNFFALFTLTEEILSYYSGEDRQGNVFCLTTRDAEGIIKVLHDCLRTGSLAVFAGDRYKYAACNLSSLYKFGTVEVRTMRGAKTAEEVNRWIDILNDMYEYSLKMRSPTELIEKLSLLGAPGLLREIFKPTNKDELLKPLPPIVDLHASLMEGARLIQVFCYEFEDAFLADFKKSEKKVENKLPFVFFDETGRRLSYAVHVPGRGMWFCSSPRYLPGEEGFWQDGEAVADDINLRWNEAVGKFCYHRPDGIVLICNWAAHPEFGDEGPHGGLLGGEIMEEAPVPDWDDPEEINDEDFEEDVGDDF